MSHTNSLYEKYGGFAALSAIVHDFYERVCASPSLASWFEDVEMANLIDHQIKFLCKALGGPDNYSGRALAAAHAGLAITPAAFSEVAEHLSASLSEAGMEDADVKVVIELVASLQAEVVGL